MWSSNWQATKSFTVILLWTLHRKIAVEEISIQWPDKIEPASGISTSLSNTKYVHTSERNRVIYMLAETKVGVDRGLLAKRTGIANYNVFHLRSIISQKFFSFSIFFQHIHALEDSNIRSHAPPPFYILKGNIDYINCFC